MNIFELIILIMVIAAFILGVVGVIIEKVRTGKSWIGQGFGRK